MLPLAVPGRRPWLPRSGALSHCWLLRGAADAKHAPLRRAIRCAESGCTCRAAALPVPTSAGAATFRLGTAPVAAVARHCSPSCGGIAHNRFAMPVNPVLWLAWRNRLAPRAHRRWRLAAATNALAALSTQQSTVSVLSARCDRRRNHGRSPRVVPVGAVQGLRAPDQEASERPIVNTAHTPDRVRASYLDRTTRPRACISTRGMEALASDDTSEIDSSAGMICHRPRPRPCKPRTHTGATPTSCPSARRRWTCSLRARAHAWPRQAQARSARHALPPMKRHCRAALLAAALTGSVHAVVEMDGAASGAWALAELASAECSARVRSGDAVASALRTAGAGRTTLCLEGPASECAPAGLQCLVCPRGEARPPLKVPSSAARGSYGAVANSEVDALRGAPHTGAPFRCTPLLCERAPCGERQGAAGGPALLAVASLRRMHDRRTGAT